MDRLSSLHESWFSLGVSRVWGSQLQFSSEWYKLNSKESKPIDTLHAYLSPKLFHGYIVRSASNQSQLNAMILCTNSLQRWYPINLNIRAILLPSSTTAISKYCSKFVQTFVHLYVTRILLDIKKKYFKWEEQQLFRVSRDTCRFGLHIPCNTTLHSYVIAGLSL